MSFGGFYFGWKEGGHVFSLATVFFLGEGYLDDVEKGSRHAINE